MIKGKLTVEFHDKVVELLPGEILVVPKGLEHKPRAKEETWIMLFEPIGIKHTGNVDINAKSDYPKMNKYFKCLQQLLVHWLL